MLRRFLNEVRMGCGRWIAKAFFEFLVNISVSMLPFIFAVVTLMLSAKLDSGFLSYVKKITSNGELIVYSATLMAPIMYAVLRDPPVAFRAGFSIFGAVPVLAGAIVYPIAMLDGFTNKLVVVSAGCFFLAIIVYLALLLVQHEFEHRKSAPQIQDNNRQDRLEGYKKHREINHEL